MGAEVSIAKGSSRDAAQQPCCPAFLVRTGSGRSCRFPSSRPRSAGRRTAAEWWIEGEEWDRLGL